MFYDLVVIGLGAIGSSVLYHASQFAKMKTLGIDQYSPPHGLGSSHGESRILRLAHLEGDHYTQLAKRSLTLWEGLNQEISNDHEAIFTKSGGILLAPPPQSVYQPRQSTLQSIKTIADKHGIAHCILNNTSIQANYGLLLSSNYAWDGYYETDMGHLSPERCITHQLKIANEQGCSIHVNEKFLDYQKLPNQLIKVITNKGTYLTNYLILALGKWIKKIVPAEVRVVRQFSAWFRLTPNFLHHSLANLPLLIIEDNEHKIACFPPTSSRPYVKILSNAFNMKNHDPSFRSFDKLFNEKIRHYFTHVTGPCIKVIPCFYTFTKNKEFLVDYLDKHVLYASCCNGQGFKHSIAVGESLIRSLMGERNELDILKIVKNNNKENHVS